MILNSYSTSRLTSLILLMLTTLITANVAFAERYVLVQKLDVKGKYSDNIAFEKDRPRSDWSTDIEPSVLLKYQTERFNFDSRIIYNLIRYLDETIEDRENQEYALNGGYNITERLRVRGGVSFRRDMTQDTKLLVTEDSELQDIEEVTEITTQQDRDRYVGEAGFLWQFNELSGIGLNYKFLKKTFETKNSVDYDRHKISLPDV